LLLALFNQDLTLLGIFILFFVWNCRTFTHEGRLYWYKEYVIIYLLQYTLFDIIDNYSHIIGNYTEQTKNLQKTS